jgi:hypothetical protein
MNLIQEKKTIMLYTQISNYDGSEFPFNLLFGTQGGSPGGGSAGGGKKKPPKKKPAKPKK